MNRFKSISAGICCALVATSLAACGSSTASSDEVEFMTMQATGTPQLKAIQELTAEFEKQNPDIKIKLDPGTNSNENDIKVRLAGNNAPDIWTTHGWSRDRYANFLEPLQNRSWAKRMKALGDDVFKTSDGKFYALPVDIQVSGIMYNETVLKEAGVDPTTLTTWDAFEAACTKIKAAGFTPIMATPKDPGPIGDLADYVLPGLYSAADLKKLEKGTFDTATYQKYTDMISKWTKAGYFNADYTSATLDDLARMMASNKSAFYFRANGNAQLMESYDSNVKLGMMPIPSAVGDPYFSTGEDIAFGVSKTSKNKESALKYLDFLAEPENMNKLVAVSMNDSALEGSTSALGQFQTTYDYWVNEKKIQSVPFFDRKYLPNGMYTTIGKSTDGVISGQQTPLAAAQQVKTSFDSLYGQKSS